MSVNHLISIRQLDPDRLLQLVNYALRVHDGDIPAEFSLEGRQIGLYFRAPSTRTRTSFFTAALKLGASVISYGPKELQLENGESVGDTSRILSYYLHGLVARTNGPTAELQALTRQDRMAVINALDESEHPTQAIADLAAIKQKFGQLEGIHVLYLGNGNNTASSLALAVARIRGMRLTVATPRGFELERSIAEDIAAAATRCGVRFETIHDPEQFQGPADVVYTTRWETMGNRIDGDVARIFGPFQVNQRLMSRVGTRYTAFMHDLPAERGRDVVDDVIDGPQSIVWKQAEHKLASAMTTLGVCVNGLLK
jgi:ornithine carbamoyltransferase